MGCCYTRCDLPSVAAPLSAARPKNGNQFSLEPNLSCLSLCCCFTFCSSSEDETGSENGGSDDDDLASEGQGHQRSSGLDEETEGDELGQRSSKTCDQRVAESATDKTSENEPETEPSGSLDNRTERNSQSEESNAGR